MHTDEYLQNQILEMYMSQMDYAIDTFCEETTIFNESFLIEAENQPALPGPVDNNANNAAKTSKLKEIIGKLKELLDRFLDALKRVGEIISTKLKKFAALIAGKFKVAGKTKQDVTICKFDVAFKNVTEIQKTTDELDTEVIKPLESGQPAKNDSIEGYIAKFEDLQFSKFDADDKNKITYKTNTIIRNATFSNMEDIGEKMITIHDNGEKRFKEYKAKLNNIQNQTADPNASDDIKLFNTALTHAIKYHQNIMKYITRCVGDCLVLSNNCEPAA